MQAGSRTLPPFPDDLQHVWWAYAQLTATRAVAQVISPITWSEIEAFNTAALAGLTAWEKRLIRRIDDAVRAVALGEINPNSQISARNGKGIAGMLRGLAARKKGQPNDRV